jgi:hypothetical protein
MLRICFILLALVALVGCGSIFDNIPHAADPPHPDCPMQFASLKHWEESAPFTTGLIGSWQGKGSLIFLNKTTGEKLDEATPTTTEWIVFYDESRGSIRWIVSTYLPSITQSLVNIAFYETFLQGIDHTCTYTAFATFTGGATKSSVFQERYIRYYRTQYLSSTTPGPENLLTVACKYEVVTPSIQVDCVLYDSLTGYVPAGTTAIHRSSMNDQNR